MRLSPWFALVAILLCTVLSHSAANGQDNIRMQLFKDADNAMNQAREKKADIYGPTSFAKAMEYYNEASDDYRRGRNLEDIRAKLRGAVSYFIKAVDACKLGEVTFSSAMAARTDAISADAAKHATALWNKAEQQLISAAKELEDGDVNDARKEAGDAEGLYRTAELEAIKANYLTPARELLKRADDMDVKDKAPKTLEKARMLSMQAEALIKQNRYDTDEARQLAQEAKYEAAHAIYLHQAITKMEKEDKEYEDLMLSAEAPIQKIAGVLDVVARFDTGFETPTKELLAVIEQRESKSRQDAETITRQEGEISNLKQQVASMEGRLGSLTEAEKDLQRKLDLRRRQEETFAQVSAMFERHEGNVLRDGSNIIIRLYGLSFPVGRNTIEPQYFSLLTKVQDAIRRFPGCQVAIEGHTDSQGSDQTNQTLSHARAEAVAQYLKANMVANTPISSQGFGETRPVASNDTFEGRAKNRRIDVVIIPEWAIVGR
jgi:outer membrane protein OmpA-like peptidoglycan-associated protein